MGLSLCSVHPLCDDMKNATSSPSEHQVLPARRGAFPNPAAELPKPQAGKWCAVAYI